MGKNRDVEQMQALDAFIDDGTIDEVLGVVKSGKEATVYCCASSAPGMPELVAAKVYRSTNVRGFANDAVANRVDERTAHAIEDYAAAIGDHLLANARTALPAIMPCAGDAFTDASIDGCIDAFIDEFGTRAYRRPLRPAEHTLARELYDAVRPDGAVPAWAALMEFFVL